MHPKKNEYASELELGPDQLSRLDNISTRIQGAVFQHVDMEVLRNMP